MAWSTSTYAGLYAFGPDGVLKVGLFELFRAVNEREGLAGITKTEWYIADGSEAADIALADLTGMFLGANHRTNLQRLYAGIRALCPYFCVTTTARTRHSVGSVEGIIGETLTPDIVGQRVMDASLLQVAQDALDVLVIIALAGAVSATGNSSTREFSGSYRSGIADAPTGELDTASDAWAARGEYSYSYSGKSWAAEIFFYTNFLHGDEYDASESLASETEIDFSAFGLSLTAGSMWYRVVGSNEFTNAWDWSFSGASDTLPGADTSDAWYEGSVLSLTAPHEIAVSVSASGGVSVPGSGSPWNASVEATQCEAIVDVSSELTDQA
jgi:hypothetical protein